MVGTWVRDAVQDKIVLDSSCGTCAEPVRLVASGCPVLNVFYFLHVPGWAITVSLRLLCSYLLHLVDISTGVMRLMGTP